MARKRGRPGNGFGPRAEWVGHGKIEDSKAEKRRARDKRDKQKGWD